MHDGKEWDWFAYYENILLLTVNNMINLQLTGKKRQLYLLSAFQVTCTILSTLYM